MILAASMSKHNALTSLAIQSRVHPGFMIWFLEATIS
jgi:hypothetical protein